MKLKNFGYSWKNIPIPSKTNYLKCMIEKVESFVKRLRWKAFYFCKEKDPLKTNHRISLASSHLQHHRKTNI